MMTAEQFYRKPTFERKVSVERAELAMTRLINSHFRSDSDIRPHARMTIPANQDDDDLVLSDFIAQTAAQLAELRKESAIAKKYEQKLLRELGRVMTALRCTDEFDGPDEAVRTANELVQALGEADKIRAELGFADTSPLNVWLADLRAQLAEKEREIERLTIAGLNYHDQWKAAEERLQEAQARIKYLENVKVRAGRGERSTS